MEMKAPRFTRIASPRRHRFAALLGAACASALLAAPAGAVIQPAVTIDGPVVEVAATHSKNRRGGYLGAKAEQKSL